MKPHDDSGQVKRALYDNGCEQGTLMMTLNKIDLSSEGDDDDSRQDTVMMT